MSDQPTQPEATAQSTASEYIAIAKDYTTSTYATVSEKAQEVYDSLPATKDVKDYVFGGFDDPTSPDANTPGLGGPGAFPPTPNEDGVKRDDSDGFGPSDQPAHPKEGSSQTEAEPEPLPSHQDQYNDPSGTTISPDDDAKAKPSALQDGTDIHRQRTAPSKVQEPPREMAAPDDVTSTSDSDIDLPASSAGDTANGNDLDGNGEVGEDTSEPNGGKKPSKLSKLKAKFHNKKEKLT